MSVKEWVRFSLLGLIWGTSFLWIKIAVSEVSPLVLVGFRTLFGALSLLVIMRFSGASKLVLKDLRPWLGIFLIVAFLNVALPFVLISWSEQFISSGMASILNSTVPLFTIMLAPLFLRDDQWSLPKMAGLVLGFVGITVIFLPELTGGVNQNLIGMGVMLLATLSYAAGSIFTRRRVHDLAPQHQAFLQLSISTAMVWAVALALESPVTIPQLPLTWMALLWLGVLGSGIAYILFFGLLHSIGPTRTTTVTYIPPLVGTILGMLFLGEQITWQAVIGGLLVILGIVVVNLKQVPKITAVSSQVQTQSRQKDGASISPELVKQQVFQEDCCQ
ncbi:MAG: DMT family transporter [Anaerolineaceae bacterium]